MWRGRILLIYSQEYRTEHRERTHTVEQKSHYSPTKRRLSLTELQEACPSISYMKSLVIFLCYFFQVLIYVWISYIALMYVLMSGSPADPSTDIPLPLGKARTPVVLHTYRLCQPVPGKDVSNHSGCTFKMVSSACDDLSDLDQWTAQIHLCHPQATGACHRQWTKFDEHGVLRLSEQKWD